MAPNVGNERLLHSISNCAQNESPKDILWFFFAGIFGTVDRRVESSRRFLGRWPSVHRVRSHWCYLSACTNPRSFCLWQNLINEVNHYLWGFGYTAETMHTKYQPDRSYCADIIPQTSRTEWCQQHGRCRGSSFHNERAQRSSYPHEKSPGPDEIPANDSPTVGPATRGVQRLPEGGSFVFRVALAPANQQRKTVV